LHVFRSSLTNIVSGKGVCALQPGIEDPAGPHVSGRAERHRGISTNNGPTVRPRSKRETLSTLTVKKIRSRQCALRDRFTLQKNARCRASQQLAKFPVQTTRWQGGVAILGGECAQFQGRTSIFIV